MVHAGLIPHRKLSVPTQFVFFSSLNQLASSVWQFVETRLLLLMDSFVWRLTTPVSKTRLDTGPEISFCEIYQEGTNRKQRKLVQRKQEPSKTYTLPLEDLSIRGPFYLNIQVYINKPKNIQKADIVTFFPQEFCF